MTTIAYRSGILAGDTRVTVDDKVITDKQRKVWKLRDGFLLGAAGSIEAVERLKRTIRSGAEPPALDNIDALLISPKGEVFLFEGNTWVKQRDPYHAVGSGYSVALAAMDVGADAITAVKIGIKRDVSSGGRCLHVKLKDK